MEVIAELMQALEKLKAEPSKANLRDLAWELAEVKESVQSLGQALMLSQDPTLAASAHKLLAEDKEAIRSGQRRVKTTLRRIVVTLDASDTGSMTGGAIRADPPPPVRTSGPFGGPPPFFQVEAGAGKRTHGG